MPLYHVVLELVSKHDMYVQAVDEDDAYDIAAQSADEISAVWTEVSQYPGPSITEVDSVKLGQYVYK